MTCLGLAARRGPPDIDALGTITQRSLEKEVRRGVRSNVVLQCPKVKGLVPGPEEQSLQIGGRAGPLENRLDPEPRHLTAKRDGQRLQMRITSELESLVGELPGLDAPVLERNIADIRTFLEKHLG